MPPKPSPPTSHRENIAQHPHRNPDYGGNPLAHIHSNNSDGTQSLRLPAFAGGLQPGLYKPPPFKFGNPVPLGLSGFALTTFLLSMINLNTRNLGGQSSMVMAPAYAYGGFVQLLAGMWEIVLGNVFGGTALSTYGGFWISLGIILTPGGFRIEHAYGIPDFYTAFAFYIFAWMIITIIFWLCTLRSTLFFTTFGSVWIAFIFLGCGESHV
ncbi:hypothetical protein KC343_g7073 [Hortaea werneckii]|nr:hypothetical protein KC323_g2928 [Hortaea werneckii]KAI7151046.1 hypothetical protein KC352_g28544 [Hortaea werneckii]KAI7352098.1 hypothetical protein KC320_g4621 [Hortaea werneckii]KAI7563997.1 hypothetical protein KC317_g7351 [Hortaea werneckii]KAI7613019.1 hypothetical protein KC346_g7534 [Hortaea werneckii]